MAAETLIHGDDYFVEYNPHPYQGGYDIALTYGPPLLPSAAICYPISAAAALPPSPVAERTPPIGIPQPEPPQDYSNPPRPEPDSPPPAAEQTPQLPPPHDYSDPGPEFCSSAPSGYWPFWTPVEEEITRWRDGSEEPGYWSQWRRAADYLFGYSQGYGERWAGTDSYGIPIYANRRHGGKSLVMHIEPARDQKLDYYDPPGSEQLHHTSYGIERETRGEMDYYGNGMTLCLQDNPIEYQKPRYDMDYYGNGMTLCLQENPIEYQNPRCDMDYYGNGMTLCLQDNPIEYQKPRYDEVYGEQVDPLYNWFSSSYDEKADKIHFLGTPEYAYNKHYYEEPLHVHLQPTETELTLTQKLSYYGDDQEYTSAEANRHSASYGDPLEPFEPTWSRNPSLYDVYEEETSPESKWPFSSNYEQEYDSHAFGSPSCANGRHYHEQALSVELEPFKPTWSQNPIYYEVYGDGVSPMSHQADDPYREIATQFFCPFQKYSDYDE